MLISPLTAVAILVPPAKGAKKATIALTWTVTDTNGKTPVTYTGTQILT